MEFQKYKAGLVPVFLFRPNAYIARLTIYDMYIRYVDESGDPGSANGSSEQFILSGLIFSYKDWQSYLSVLKRFRKYLKNKYGLGVYTEVHAKELLRIKDLKAYKKISKSKRILILKEYAKFIPAMFPRGKIINICLRKSEFVIVYKKPRFQTEAQKIIFLIFAPDKVD